MDDGLMGCRPSGFSRWLRSIQADAVAERQRRARLRAWKRSRPFSRLQLNLYRFFSLATIALAGIMLLGAR